MKTIVFIIVLFLIFSKTFAFKNFSQCNEVDFFSDSIKFLSNNQVSLTLNGPDREDHTSTFPCCLQQGPMIISDYKIYVGGDKFYTIVSDRTFENGYNQENIINENDCKNSAFDCSRIYQGQRDYTRVDTYDPTKFPPPGGNIGVSFVVYAKCYHHIETICFNTCIFTSGIIYDPPNPVK